MTRVTFITPDGDETIVDATPGGSLLEAAQWNGVPMLGTCGGSMVCATCHVMISGDCKALVPPPSDDEAGTVELAYGATADSRLACQITVCDALEGLVVRLAPTMHSA